MRRHASPSTKPATEARIIRRNAVIAHLSQYSRGNDRRDPPTVDGPGPENILDWAIFVDYSKYYSVVFLPEKRRVLEKY